MTYLATNERNRMIVLDYVKNHPSITSHQLAKKTGWTPAYCRNLLNWLARRGEAMYTWRGGCKTWFPVSDEVSS